MFNSVLEMVVKLATVVGVDVLYHIAGEVVEFLQDGCSLEGLPPLSVDLFLALLAWILRRWMSLKIIKQRTSRHHLRVPINMLVRLLFSSLKAEGSWINWHM